MFMRSDQQMSNIVPEIIITDICSRLVENDMHLHKYTFTPDEKIIVWIPNLAK